MIKKVFLSLSLTLGLSLNAATILEAVADLDRNDMAEFKRIITTFSDANLAREDNQKTLLMYACWIENKEAVEYLIEKGANVNASDNGGATPLHLAVWKENISITELLLKNGASVSALSLDGMTPGDIVLLKKNDNLIKLLDQYKPKLKPLL